MCTMESRPYRVLSLAAIGLIALWGILSPHRAWARDDAPQFKFSDHHGGDDGDGDDDNDDNGHGRHAGVCGDLHGRAFGLCVAFCEAQHCQSHPNRVSCEVLRVLFEHTTGSSVFPCEVTGTPTAAATSTSTATHVPATNTATAVPTDTATAVPTNTATSSATSTATGTPTGTVAATFTSTPTQTAPPTGTATAVATNTATSAATTTATGTPTGTAAATVTDTPVATSTATSAATATNTAAAVNTNTATSAPTNTATNVATATATSAPTGTATSVPTATDTPTATTVPTPTATTGPSCPLTAGRYTETTTGGVLKVSTFQPFAFPSGGMTVQDVNAPDANCVHNTVIPYPGGFSTPIFCVPALGYTVSVTQTGCGIGIIDSDGGSDLTTTEKGDTSFTSGSCAAGQATCTAGLDSSGEIDITVGDGVADTCSSGGTGNAMVSIPVETVTWLAEDSSCPDADGAPPEGGDTIITQFPQTLDLTTDRATAQFADNDANGCSLAGAGPAGPYTTNQVCFAAGNPYACCTGAGTGTCVGNGAVGKCIDFVGNTVDVAAGGTVFSSAAPLHDLLFTTVQNSNISAPTAFGGATCASPPVIDFNGLAHRCIIAP